MKRTQTDLDAAFVDKIRAYLFHNERTTAWLSKKSGISYSHLYFVLNGERRPTDRFTKKINQVINGDN